MNESQQINYLVGISADTQGHCCAV